MLAPIEASALLAQVLWNVNLWCDKQPTPTWAGGAGAAGPWSAANTKVTNSVQGLGALMITDDQRIQFFRGALVITDDY